MIHRSLSGIQDQVTEMIIAVNNMLNIKKNNIIFAEVCKKDYFPIEIDMKKIIR